jgi:hypothetical protein
MPFPFILCICMQHVVRHIDPNQQKFMHKKTAREKSGLEFFA